MPFKLVASLLIVAATAAAVQIPRPPAHGGCVAVAKGELGAPWHLLSDSHRVRVEVERRLYQAKDSGRFYIHLRITNDGDAPVAVDLRDARQSIYPNQWELDREPRRGPVDELRTLKVALGPEREAELAQASARHALSEISAHHVFDFYCESIADLDDAGGFADGCYLVVSLDGQLLFTDGQAAWQVSADALSSISSNVVVNRAEVVFPLPLALSPLPESSFIVRAPAVP
jgi:hypothetical protein